MQVLAGSNTYTGGTTISGGTLQLGNGGATGRSHPADAITDNATLAFNRSNTITQGTDFAGVISGTGGVLQAGSGSTLILTGANTYSGATTISAGTLQVGNGNRGTLGSGSVTDNATLSFGRSDAWPDRV